MSTQAHVADVNIVLARASANTGWLDNTNFTFASSVVPRKTTSVSVVLNEFRQPVRATVNTVSDRPIVIATDRLTYQLAGNGHSRASLCHSTSSTVCLTLMRSGVSQLITEPLAVLARRSADGYLFVNNTHSCHVQAVIH
jgi:hypothetical protein